MSKKLFRTIGKIAGVVAVVAGVVLAIPTGGASLGISAAVLGTLGTIATIATVVSLGAGILAGKPKSPASSPASKDRLIASIDPRTPRKIVFGNTAMATDIRDQEFLSSQTYLSRFIVVASHAVQSIDTIYFDDKLAWTLAGGAQGEFVGYLTITPILEGTAGNAINISARMGTTRRYTGCAYVHIQYKLTGNTKKTTSPFAQSIATRMTIIGKGWKTYDPRLDSTVAGGSGAHRANNQATWAWDANASRNPAIQLLNYYLGWKIAGKLAVGKGIPSARLDLPSFITAANICDESVSLLLGGTEPRYRSDGVFSESDGLQLVNDNFKAAMNAELDDVDGKIRCTVLSNDLGSPIADFGDDDILGDVDWQQTSPLDESFNVIRGTYVDASTNSLYQPVDYPQPTPLTSPDGIDRIFTFDLPIVQSSGQAQRLAKQHLQRQQYTGTLSFTGQVTWWRVQKNDVVRLTFTPLGWSNKLFRVVSMTTRVDGTVPLVLREENAAIYAWSAEDSAAVVAAAPTTYDFTLNPVYQDATNALSVDLGFVATGSQPPAIVANTLTNSGATTHQSTVRARAFPGSVIASADIVQGALKFTIVTLSQSASSISATSEDLYCFYKFDGTLYIERAGVAVLSTTITASLTGKLTVGYDGARFRVFVNGTEYAATDDKMKASGPGLILYPRWTPFDAGTIMTGLAAAAFTENDFQSIGGLYVPEKNATTGGNLIFNGDGEQGDTRGWAVDAGWVTGTFSISTAQKQSGVYSLSIAKAATGDQMSAGTRAISVKPGDKYLFRVWAYAGAAVGSGFYLRIHEHTGATSLPFITNALAVSSTDPIGNNALAAGANYYEVSYTVPAGINVISPCFINFTNGPVALWVEIQMTKIVDWAVDVVGTNKPADNATRNVNRGVWSGASVAYVVGDFVNLGADAYTCGTAHTSSGANGPPGANWVLLTQALAPVAASTTITLTSQTETTAAIVRTIPNGGSLSVLARFRSGTTAGSGTQTYKTEWRVKGGTYATLTTVNQAYVTGEVIALNAGGTITNSAGFDQVYEIRSVASVSGGGGEPVVEERSYVTA